MLGCVSKLNFADARKLAKNLGPAPVGGGKHDAHHIVMSNSKDPKMVELREKMESFDIDVNDKRNGIWLPNKVSDQVEGLNRTAHKGQGVHGKAYKQYIYDKLSNTSTRKEFLNELKQIKSELNNGKVFPLAR